MFYIGCEGLNTLQPYLFIFQIFHPDFLIFCHRGFFTLQQAMRLFYAIRNMAFVTTKVDEWYHS